MAFNFAGRFSSLSGGPFGSSPGDGSLTLYVQADYEYIDNPCCGTLEPRNGIVGSDGSIQFVITPNRHGTYFVEVTVLDEQDRQTCGEVEIRSKLRE
jgi:hypothetical protein